MSTQEYKAQINASLAEAARAVQSEDWPAVCDHLTDAKHCADQIPARQTAEHPSHNRLRWSAPQG